MIIIEKIPFIHSGYHVLKYYNIADTTLLWNKIRWNGNMDQLNPAHGKTNNFLVNYYGPPSGYKMAGTNYPPWNTFPRYSLYRYLIRKNLNFSNNDIDWMSQFLPIKFRLDCRNRK